MYHHLGSSWLSTPLAPVLWMAVWGVDGDMVSLCTTTLAVVVAGLESRDALAFADRRLAVNK